MRRGPTPRTCTCVGRGHSVAHGAGQRHGRCEMEAMQWVLLWAVLRAL